MNVGQILETHLGWACSELGEKVNKLCNEYISQQKTLEQIKGALGKIYNKDEIEKEIKQLKEDETIDLLQNLSNGVPIATPVFDGAKC